MWFRVDDKFHGHDKVTRIPRSIRAEAIGTWTLCGTWSAKMERDGFVPEHIVDEVGGTAAGAEALVTVKMWRRKRDGFQFVNWEEYQFTREELVAKRRSESQRKAEYRARKARESAGASADVPTGHDRDPDYPSRPVPIDDVTTDTGHPHVSSGAASDDLSTGLSPVVENVVGAVREHCGVEVHPLVVSDITAWIDSRRGPRARPIENPARYYPRAIATSAAELQKFIYERGLAS